MRQGLLHAKHRLRGVLYYLEGFGRFAGLLSSEASERQETLGVLKGLNSALNAAYVNEKCTSSLNRFKEKEVVVDMRSHLAPHDLVLLLEGELHSKYTYISNSNKNWYLFTCSEKRKIKQRKNQPTNGNLPKYHKQIKIKSKIRSPGCATGQKIKNKTK